MIKIFRRLPAFILTAALTALTVLSFSKGVTGTVSADVGQPEIFVPPLEEVHCTS